MSPTKCPYCGKKISFFKAFMIRRRGEYYCKRCKKVSNIHIKKTIWIFFFFVLMMALATMGYYLLFADKEKLSYVIFTFVIFVLFYLFSPLFIRLRPKIKTQDSLYDTEMVDNTEPDPTMAKNAKVVPAFVDDVVLGDEDIKPTINSEIFNAIKEERKIVGETDGGTKSFDKFENISSNKTMGDTMAVGDLKDIPKIEEEKVEKAAANDSGDVVTELFTDTPAAAKEADVLTELFSDSPAKEDISDAEIEDILTEIKDV